MNKERARRYLQQFDSKTLFIEELGWDHYDARHIITVDDQTVTVTAVAEKRNFVVLCCDADVIPPYATRRKIERCVAKLYQEHLIIYVDGARQRGS